jgi:DNA-binding NtrC family response regulator
MEALDKLKFFIVDDDVFCTNVYKQYLQNSNYEDVTCFTNGFDCIENLNQNPDIIFLDHNMEDLTGFEVLKKIKRFNPNIYIVMISAQESINTAVDALKYGAFDYMVKDATVCEKMQKVIERILKIKEEIKKSNPTTIQKILSIFI